jgi:prophage antirepressor-like protein
MNSNIVSFAFHDRSVRTAKKDDGSIWFCLADCLAAMESKTDVNQAKKSIESSLGADTLIKLPAPDALGQEQNTLFISESGVTFLLTRSRTVAGKALNKFIHCEILPSIRKTGGYQVKPSEIPSIPQTYSAALLEAGRLAMELEAASAKIKADAPLVEYAEAVKHSDTSVEFNEFAKMIGTGRTRLFRAMREAGVIMKNSTLPYQQFIDAGYFEVSQEITDNGKLIPFALVTGKGQIWLTQRLVSKHQFEQKLIGAISNGVKQMSILGES